MNKIRRDCGSDKEKCCNYFLYLHMRSSLQDCHSCNSKLKHSYCFNSSASSYTVTIETDNKLLLQTLSGCDVSIRISSLFVSIRESCFFVSIRNSCSVLQFSDVELFWNSFLATSRSQIVAQHCWGSQQSEKLTLNLPTASDNFKQPAPSPLTLESHLTVK